MTRARWVYSFGDGRADGGAAMKALLGGKGANLAEMAGLGLPVPPGFTITTEACNAFFAANRQPPPGLAEEVAAALRDLERATGKGFGDPDNPLLVSVRSGARASMPGMMDTVLNLGLNDQTVAGLSRLADERFALDCYRRFIQMYGNVVLGLDHHMFEEILDDSRDRLGLTLDAALSADDWREVVEEFKSATEGERGEPFPQDPTAQLWGAIGAVFDSWRNERAQFYRRMHAIPEDWGTAVNVQAMVFGNMGETSATGVAFTRDPSTGEKRLFGEFLVNAQGEDVVAGLRTPQTLTRASRHAAGDAAVSMEEAMPEAFAQLQTALATLEAHYCDMQDVEFTVERGRLFLLQTRSGKRTAAAALRIAVEMASEGLIEREEAVARIEPASLDQLLHPTLDPAAERDEIACGLPASPGAATGRIVFSAEAAEREAASGPVILVRDETSPEDIRGMDAARGIVTARGGMTSHAAVVARGMGRACVCGAAHLRIDAAAQRMTVKGEVFLAGQVITIDGSTGQILRGAVAMVEPQLSGEFATLMEWADGFRRLRVRANAETTADATTARRFGAEGVGLVRTEHMFFDEARLSIMRQMILAEDEAGRREALAKILPMQRGDFAALLALFEGLPVTFRLLDPPLHEFLPSDRTEAEALAQTLGVDSERLVRRTQELREINPMLGHRGCRLGVAYPEIYEMQVRAIIEAACEAASGDKVLPQPEIMHPLVASGGEMDFLRALTDRVAAEVMAEKGVQIPYSVGTMIELPRAALVAGELARTAEFFSFGTNDLTQTTFGISRDDSGRFLNVYIEKGLLPGDSFVSLDESGVGALILMAAERGRAERSDLKLGLCGEHGGDPASVAFCEQAGLDYVSCSAYRVPIARLAAAQAALAGRATQRG